MPLAGEMLDAVAAIRAVRKARAVTNEVLRALPAQIGARIAAEFHVDPQPAIDMATRYVEAVIGRLADQLDAFIDSVDPARVAERRRAYEVVATALSRGLSGHA
jgi:hypothetical protein